MKSLLNAFLLLICTGFLSNVAAHPSWAIVVNDKNEIFVSDLTKIWKIDASGRVSLFKEIHSHELRLDKDGNLLGEELNYNPSTGEYKSALWRITPGGEFAYTLQPTTQPQRGISLWKNSRGATYYFGQTDAEPRDYFLLKREPSGNVKVLLGNERKALSQPQVVPYSLTGMALRADETVYFKNATTVWKAAPNDTVSVVVGANQFAEIAPNPQLFGLAVDAENNLYTADYNSRKVLKIGADKKISVVAESEKNWAPTGVFHKNKILYWLEFEVLPSGAAGALRVRKIEADGKAKTITTIGKTQTAQIQSAENSRAQTFAAKIAPENRQSLCIGIGFLFLAAVFLAKRK